MKPVWMCPLRLRGDRAWTLYPLRPGDVYVNFGFWGTVPLPPGSSDGYYNRMVEEEVSALGGHKSLYSTAFYSEEEFRRRYNGAAYDKLKAEYDGGGRLLGLYDKCVPRDRLTRQTMQQRRKERHMALAEVFEAIAGPDAPVEFQAYDGSTAGAPGSPVKITVRSPIAVVLPGAGAGRARPGPRLRLRPPGRRRRHVHRAVPAVARPGDRT